MSGWDHQSILHGVNIALASATALCAAGALRFYFVNWRQTSGVKVALAASVLGCTAAHVLAFVWTPDVPLVCQVLGTLGYLAANLLFWWAVWAHGKNPPAVAFAAGPPAALVLHGPYRYVRHPMYTAYTLAWLAGCLATANPWLLLSVVWMFGFYYAAARGEEGAILRSGFADVYTAYRKRSGMFFPKLLRWRPAGEPQPRRSDRDSGGPR